MTTFTLPELPYAYDSLQPYMSVETLEFHHDKHHKAYVDKGNELLKGSGLENKSLDEIVVASYKEKKQALFNNAGQHWNHIHFWNWMNGKKGGGSKLPGKLQSMVDSDLGGYDGFKKAFTEGGVGQFGSGWVWLVLNKDGKLEVTKTPNGENPLALGQGHALLGCDVWEHSYYIDYRNARPKYMEAFVDHLINWEYVEHRLEEAGKAPKAA